MTIPSSRPASGRAPRAAAVKDVAAQSAAPAEPARSVLDRASTVLGWTGRRSGRTAQRLLLVLAQIVHVEVAMLLEPVLVGLHREGPHQPQTAVAIREDAHDMGPPLDLLVQALQHVGRLEVLMVLARQPVKGQGLVDILFDPTGELEVFAGPFSEPEIAARLGEVAAIIEPTQLLQAVVIDATWHVVERVAQKMHVAALIGRLRQSLAQR